MCSKVLKILTSDLCLREAFLKSRVAQVNEELNSPLSENTCFDEALKKIPCVVQNSGKNISFKKYTSLYSKTMNFSCSVTQFL